jgi:hypothetical protein
MVRVDTCDDQGVLHFVPYSVRTSPDTYADQRLLRASNLSIKSHTDQWVECYLFFFIGIPTKVLGKKALHIDLLYVCVYIYIWRTYCIYSSMVYSLSEANSPSSSHEIPRILWNLKVHYCVHKSLPLFHNLGHINPVHATASISWISILILSFHLRLGLLSGPFLSGFPTKTLHAPPSLLPHTCRMPRLSHSS